MDWNAEDLTPQQRAEAARADQVWADRDAAEAKRAGL